MKFAVLMVMNVNFSEETEHEKYRRLYPVRWEVIALHSHQLLHDRRFFYFNSYTGMCEPGECPQIQLMSTSWEKMAAITIGSNASKPVATETHLQRKC